MKERLAAFRFANWKLGVKYSVPLIITIILFIVSTVWVSGLLFSIGNKIDEVELRSTRAIQLTEMGSLFRAKDIRVSDYISTFDPAKIDEFNEIKEEFTVILDELYTKMESDEQKEMFGQVLANDQTMTRIFLEEIVPASNNGQFDKAIQLRKQTDALRSDTLGLLDSIKDMATAESDQAVAEAKEQSSVATTVLTMAGLLSVIVSAAVAVLLSLRLQKHINEVIQVSDQIASGNLAVEEIRYNAKDEIGSLASSVNKMSRSLREVIQQITAVSQTVSSQSEALTQMSKEVKAGSEQIAVTMQELAAGSEHQATASSQIAELIETLNEQIETAAQDGEVLMQSSEGVLRVSLDGASEMDNSVAQMNTINQLVQDSLEKVKSLEMSTANITKLVQVIEDIAQQTNLLALNASIEAARAGEQGRGFAVVAGEVKKLAEQTGKSATEVTAIISSVLHETKRMVEALERGYAETEEGSEKIVQAKGSFDRIAEAVSGMAERIESVTAGLRDINGHSGKIHSASQEIVSVSEESAAGVEQTSASAQQQTSSMEEVSRTAAHLSALSEEMGQLVNRFKL